MTICKKVYAMQDNKNCNSIREKTMMLILLYVLLSACGLVFLKIGASHDLKITVSGSTFEIKLNIYVIIGLLCYVSSFIVSLVAMSKTNLNIFYPISAGLGYILVCMASYLILKESFSVMQITGTIIILIGVIVMNLK